LQALRADLLHHALHRRVDRGDRTVIRPEKVLQARPARLGDGGADRNDSVDLLQRNVSRPERARAVGVDRLNDIADKGQIPRPGVKPGGSSQHQTNWSAARSMSSTR
jgi:hypothetical protein